MNDSVAIITRTLNQSASESANDIGRTLSHNVRHLVGGITRTLNQSASITSSGIRKIVNG
jgi:hypothetical protein